MRISRHFAAPCTAFAARKNILCRFLALIVLGGSGLAQEPYTLKRSIAGSGASASFGNSVAISGTLMVVGAYYDNTGAFYAGRAYVYNLSSGTPTVPVATLNNPGPAASAFFGTSVVISGTRVVVGVPGDSTGASQAGSAYVYDLSSATPTVPLVTLNNPEPTPNDNFGSSVAISGTRVIV